MKIVVDGELLEGSQIEIDVSSMGLSYGYGVFETIRFQDRLPCFWQEHVSRLIASASEAGMAVEYSADELLGEARRLFAENEVDQGVFKILVFRDKERLRTVLFVRNEGASERLDSIRARVSKIIKSSKAFTSRSKSLNYMENMLEFAAAREHGFDECVFTNEEGSITECAISNLFFFSDGMLKTPSLECGILNGVIRGKLLEIAAENAMLVEEGEHSVEELLEADAVFVSNSGWGIVGLSDLDSEKGTANYENEKGEKVIRLLREGLRAKETESIRLLR